MTTTAADGSIVLRSPTPVRLLFIATCLVPFVVISGALRDVGSLVGAVIGFSVVYVLLFRNRRVVLTPAGLEVWRLGREVIPWSAIASVEVTGMAWNSRTIRVAVTPARVVRLPAPTSGFGIGTQEVANAAAQIEQWRQHYQQPAAR